LGAAGISISTTRPFPCDHFVNLDEGDAVRGLVRNLFLQTVQIFAKANETEPTT
jgi:hypothetical protein